MAESAAATISSIIEAVKAPKDRYARFRLMILGVVLVNILVSFVLFFSIGRRDVEADLWFKPGFPNDLVVIRNESGGIMRDVQIVLDGRYRATVRLLKPGVKGLILNSEFFDTSQETPETGYKPRKAEIRHDGDSVNIELKVKK